jgi:hypothetical protein
MLKAAIRERHSGRMIELEADHGNLYDILNTWMNVPEVIRIRQTYCSSSPEQVETQNKPSPDRRGETQVDSNKTARRR